MDDAYALIVGIADYLHVTKLSAAVRNDARPAFRYANTEKPNGQRRQR